MLAYGITTEFIDEYIQNGERAAMKSMKKFVESIVKVFLMNI